jgi:hypothetical protein
METEIRMEVAGPLTFSDEEMSSERTARLLEVGEYPDKGLTLTEGDLDGLIARFSAGLPVKVEHTDSPLDPLGKVQRVWREGGALFGMLAFPSDLGAFLRRRGAAKLSVGLHRDPLRLAEVSLVLKPRVAAATLMSGDGPLTPNSGGTGSMQEEIGRLRLELTAQAVETQIGVLKEAGRVVPATEALARALLSVPRAAMVTLSDGPEPVAEVFRRFLMAQPPVVTFGETVSAGKAADEHGFTHYEHTFLSERLGVDPAKVAALLREESTKKENGKKEETHAY